MLVLNLAEDFLYDIFEGDDAAGAAKLIHDHGERLFLLEEHLHQLAGGHRLGHVGHLLDVVEPFLGLAEHLGGMDVAGDMVNVFVIDDDLRLAALHEDGHQLVERAVVFHGLDFGSGHHTVAHLGISKVERILEDLDLFVDIVLILSVVDAGLYQVVEVHLREGIVVLLLLHLKAEDAEDDA